MYFIDGQEPQSITYHQLFDEIAPRRGLDEYMEATLFTSSALMGGPLLVYLSADFENIFYFVVSTTSIQKIQALETGKCTMVEALSSDWIWVAKTEGDYTPVKVWQLETLKCIRPEFLPADGIYLAPAFQPETRAAGNSG